MNMLTKHFTAAAIIGVAGTMAVSAASAASLNTLQSARVTAPIQLTTPKLEDSKISQSRLLVNRPTIMGW
jgi:hypothetical protein